MHHHKKHHVKLEHLQHHEEGRPPIPRGQVVLKGEQGGKAAHRVVRHNAPIDRRRLPKTQAPLVGQLRHHPEKDHDDQYVVIAKIQGPFPGILIPRLDLGGKHHGDHQDVDPHIHPGHRHAKHHHADGRRHRDGGIAHVKMQQNDQEAAEQQKDREYRRLETALRHFTTADTAL